MPSSSGARNPLSEQIRRRDGQAELRQLELRDVGQPTIIRVELFQLRLDEPDVGDTPRAILAEFPFHIREATVWGCDLDNQKRWRFREFVRVPLEQREVWDPKQILRKFHSELRAAFAHPIQQHTQALLGLAVGIFWQRFFHKLAMDQLRLTLEVSREILLRRDEYLACHLQRRISDLGSTIAGRSTIMK